MPSPIFRRALRPALALILFPAAALAQAPATTTLTLGDAARIAGPLSGPAEKMMLRTRPQSTSGPRGCGRQANSSRRIGSSTRATGRPRA